MVDFGGMNVPELSQDTKDGLLDPSTLRRVPASITNPLATVAEGGNPTLTMILKGRISGAFHEFFDTPGGLVLRLLASTSVPFQYLVNGLIKTLTADVDLTLTNNAHNFIWVDGDGVMGRSDLPCYYQYGAPSLLDGQHWYDLSQSQMKVYDAFLAEWVNVDRVFIGYARAASGSIQTPTVSEQIGLTPMDRWRKFGTAEDGFLSVGSGTTTIDGEKQYAAVVIYGTGVVKHTAATTSQLLIKSQGIIVVLNTGGFNLDAIGAARPGGRGGLGGAGAGGGNGATAGTDGGDHLAPPVLSYQGGGAHSTVDNVPGVDGEDSTIPDGIEAGVEPWPILATGIGGGGGDGGGTAPNGQGGNGGGSVLLKAPSIAFSATAVLTAMGTDGTSGGASGRGGGGGGGGGIFGFYAYEYKNTGSDPVVSGGLGGAEGGGAGSNGGTGGAGSWFWRYPAA